MTLITSHALNSNIGEKIYLISVPILLIEKIYLGV